MTRLWRDGRTETVRAATSGAIEYARAMVDENVSDERKYELFRKAEAQHKTTCINAMLGRGVDRHLFGLYVICAYLNLESGFLKKVFGMTWKLSTSQIPDNQLESFLKK